MPVLLQRLPEEAVSGLHIPLSGIQFCEWDLVLIKRTLPRWEQLKNGEVVGPSSLILRHITPVAGGGGLGQSFRGGRLH